MNDSLSAIDQTPALKIRQKKEWGEILTGWETKNRYEVMDDEGQPLFFAGEVGTGIISRQFLGSRRPFTIEVRDGNGQVALVVKRPWRFLFARAEIFDGAGNPLGAIQQRFAVLTRRYTLEDATGAEVAELHGPFFRPWTFRILSGGQECGKIYKQWSGLLKEAFSDADHFGVEFGRDLDFSLRAICLGATFLIDYVHFERSK